VGEAFAPVFAFGEFRRGTSNSSTPGTLLDAPSIRSVFCKHTLDWHAKRVAVKYCYITFIWEW